MRRGLALLLTATLALSMTACGGSKGAGTQKSEKGDGMTYAVEAGSAGEAVAKEKGFNYNSVSSQADALMEADLLCRLPKTCCSALNALWASARPNKSSLPFSACA